MKLSTFTDQLNRDVTLPFPPRKIVSLVPSITETLCELGLEEELTAVTKFCVHPAHIRKSKQVIGGTKNLRIETIRQLQPDLIIANKEENEQEQVRALEELFPVWISDVKTFDDGVGLIVRLGEITGKTNEAKFLSEKVWNVKRKIIRVQPSVRCIYLIWKDPYMTIGGDTFISDMMETAGFKNLVIEKKRYPEITFEEIRRLEPDVVLLSSEPFPFGEKHIQELNQFLPGTKIILVDGEMFSWYGSRMADGLSYCNSLAQQFATEK